MSDFRDTIFVKEGPVKPFEFNTEVAAVFDEMAVRSIPFYKETQQRIFEILSQKKQKPKIIFDLGTSTGNLIFFLCEKWGKPLPVFHGYDNSPAMIEQARQHLEQYNLKNNIHFHIADIFEKRFENADVIILNYVLQFIKPEKRQQFLKSLYDDLNPGGVLIISEKTQPENTDVAKIFLDCHDTFRLNNHYSMLQISQKRKALENVLIPLSLRQNLALLAKAGFDSAEPFLIWHNFASIMAIKPDSSHATNP